MDEKLKELMSNGWSYRVYKVTSGGDGSGGSGDCDCEETQSYILIDEEGNEIPAVLVSEETVFNATANDIREGMVAATDNGVTIGTKYIPSYNTSEGIKFIPAGSSFELNFAVDNLNLYDYTKLQAIFCLFNTNVSDSVKSEKVVIEDKVYNVNATEAIADINKDHDSKTIKFGVVNDTDKPYILRFFTYKEVI